MRAGLSVPRHPREDDARVAFGQDVVTQPPPLECAGAEVLHDHVGVLGEVEEQPSPGVRAQVEGGGAFVARVDRPEDVLAVDLRLSPGTERIGLAGGLDLDHVCAHVAEETGRERPCDQRTELEYADTGECTGVVCGGRHQKARWTVFSSVCAVTPDRPSSRPKPLASRPPQGRCGSGTPHPLTHTVPTRSRGMTECAVERSEV